jgi:HK97 family phage prohead protease
MNRKAFECEYKALEGDSGAFTGLASVYGNVDQHGDIVMPGAFAKSIAAKGNEIPLLWQHRMDMPIGMGRLVDSDQGLILHGQLALDVAAARECYALMKARVVKGLSIGYEVVAEKVEGAVRRLTEIDLWEVSAVTFPANRLAQVTTVKDVADLARELKAGRVLSAENMRRLQSALTELSELLAAAQPPASDEPPAEPSATAAAADDSAEVAELVAAFKSHIADVRSFAARL